MRYAYALAVVVALAFAAAVVRLWDYGARPDRSVRTTSWRSTPGTVASPHLTVRLSTSTDILAPGGETTLIADITPQPNMHVYAPGQEGYIPIGLAINRTNTFRTSPPAFPDPEPYFFAPLKQTVNVFSKPFRITSVLTIGRSPDIDRRAAAGDTVRVAGRLTYQACDDAVCYRSETLPVMWVVGLRKH